MVLILVGLSSCFGSKKTTLPLPESPRTEEPALPEDPETPEPMDTLVLQELDTLRSPVPVVDQATEPHSDAAVLEEDMTRMYKDEYALTVLLPFFANDSTSLATNRVAAWSLDFYLGFKLAFANLNRVILILPSRCWIPGPMMLSFSGSSTSICLKDKMSSSGPTAPPGHDRCRICAGSSDAAGVPIQRQHTPRE
ncbi:MAG: hypothetical protein R2787_02100 [Saprospiraceae bacterium]